MIQSNQQQQSLSFLVRVYLKMSETERTELEHEELLGSDNLGDDTLRLEREFTSLSSYFDKCISGFHLDAEEADRLAGECDERVKYLTNTLDSYSFGVSSVFLKN